MAMDLNGILPGAAAPTPPTAIELVRTLGRALHRHGTRRTGSRRACSRAAADVDGVFTMFKAATAIVSACDRQRRRVTARSL